MTRRITNITEDTLEVPALNARIAPGDTIDVPDDMDSLVFPENYFDVDGQNDGGKEDTAPANGEYREITASDTASAVDTHQEGN